MSKQLAYWIGFILPITVLMLGIGLVTGKPSAPAVSVENRVTVSILPITLKYPGSSDGGQYSPSNAGAGINTYYLAGGIVAAVACSVLLGYMIIERRKKQKLQSVLDALRQQSESND